MYPGAIFGFIKQTEKAGVMTAEKGTKGAVFAFVMAGDVGCSITR